MSRQISKSDRVVRSLVSAFVSIFTSASLFCAAFIFTCGMKALDGPQGANNEAPVMLGMLLVALWYPVMMYWDFRKIPGERSIYVYSTHDGNGMWYKLLIGLVVVDLGAAFIGLHMQFVQWGSGIVHLQVCSFITIGLAVSAAILAFVHSRLPTFES